MNSKNTIILLIIASVFYGLFIGCEEQGFVDDPSASLSLSTDTVMFDTVFTTIGSATKRFTAKNPYNKKINIGTIKLAGGKGSDYQLNINGTPTHSMSDVVLNPHDSLYIFAEVTIEPNNENNPLIVKDSVIFNINGNTQDIKLIAWGQDVHLVKNEVLKTKTWKADKPYLVYNSATVDTQQTLTIEPGTKVHFHRNSRFYVAGTLISDGTKEKPILFTGDRLEEDYVDIPGQWDGIWLMPGSSNNVINYTNIKNAVIGIQVDSLGNNDSPTLALSNSKVEHMTYAGVFARGTSIKAYNNVISDCGQYAVALTQGGSYEFYHTTMANYWSGSTRSTPALLLNNYYTDTNDKEQLRRLKKPGSTTASFMATMLMK
ncbi:MAG: right-handed parallel beta-helix repeat-containing protein [Bacteroidota bacterium]